MRKGDFALKTYRKMFRKYFFLMLLVASVLAIVGCSKKQPTQTQMVKPPDNGQTTNIQLDDSKVGDALGDIGEEDRSDLGWLPNRPPQGTRFQDTSELQTVYFEFDKYSLTQSARETLEANAMWMKDHPNVLVQIEGHCDERGTDEYNMVLGENRAFSVKKYLVSLGIKAEQLYTISYGESMPAVPGSDEQAWAKNRRAQFKVAQQ
ncbi:peptidoglycan-associated lipoprotein [Candidatus Moduliflexus flocculans]|uniref:Peptidoglycan-associated lipoprotein n=1 Tax=Candidatus Moduliflexus flocculans TaxID=1499966 RepID=A0A081BQK3_9BACT|nr:peptidoglycan-associated lipoprotein [Candidatus Moduliflexus flocculans]